MGLGFLPGLAFGLGSRNEGLGLDDRTTGKLNSPTARVLLRNIHTLP